jgi:hypothetical protein
MTARQCVRAFFLPFKAVFLPLVDKITDRIIKINPGAFCEAVGVLYALGWGVGYAYALVTLLNAPRINFDFSVSVSLSFAFSLEFALFCVVLWGVCLYFCCSLRHGYPG